MGRQYPQTVLDSLLHSGKQQLIIQRECIWNAKAKLDKRLLDFTTVATSEERETLEESRKRLLDMIQVAKVEQEKEHPNQSDNISLATRVKRGWHVTAEVAYEYTKMLDVMVGQAPEYIALAYGAVKILLVVQINNEELRQKVELYIQQILLKFQIIDHLTSYVPSSNIVIGVAQAYSLFYCFLAKAVKYYTLSRLSRSLIYMDIFGPSLIVLA